ncbi:copper resistance CopC family protein [Corynebacterium provencense]|jgi:methionine-rich copper-binding protein CopC|uniref:CopC domain-containing protein n=1 Tax=Corynebacterium provencense TaxID=1737425 RepID=A0A2Z3YVJ7_9CORY|nr:copper resistance CopC family protein [Corynebacterium provencense]AWT26087.1 hypothetical protein Csp1_12940 [Corynebacterium provencense]MCI1256887.1 copper resistance protein CopC [Corynebacterium provencense]
MTRLYRAAAAPLLAGALLLAPAVTGAGADLLPAASAHDALVGATPADGAVLDTAPREIRLEFSAPPRGTYDTVALSRDGEVIISETPELDGSILTVEIPADKVLTDGEYTVGYQITSSDGHATRGSYKFTLSTGTAASSATGTTESTGSGSTEATPGESESSESADNGLPGWAGPALGVVGVLVLAGVLVMLIARLRRNGD